MLDYEKKISEIINHIHNVQRNTYKLGILLIKKGDIEIGKNLIANGLIHDNSKLKGIEFEYLYFGSGHAILADVLRHHQITNCHHCEYWGCIRNMPDLYLAEMICDWNSRSEEFKTDVREWIFTKATYKYNFSMEEEIGKKILYYLNLLLEK